MSDHVVIRIPATTQHIALVRATASTIAALLDFTYDRITDLHIALDEVCSRILATSHPAASRMEVRFTMDKGAVAILAAGDSPLKDGEEFLTAWSRAILEAVTEGFEIRQENGIQQASFRVTSE